LNVIYYLSRINIIKNFIQRDSIKKEIVEKNDI